MIEIKQAKIEDTAAMREVAIQSYSDTFSESNTPENLEAFFKEAYSLEKMRKEYDEPGSMLYLACEGSRVAGFLRLRTTQEVEKELGLNTIELQRLYIHKDFQNQKVGKMLMQKAIDYAVEKKFEWIWLGVWERNFNAQRFYNKWGFEKFGEHVFQMGDDPQIDWLMKKSLKN
jgi:ribosomal protein S18 acetylase RimI-like enzyme